MRGRRWIATGLGVLAVAAAALALRRGGADEDAGARLTLAGTLGGTDTAGYARALESRAFVFPEDHAPHPDFRTEWWYVTGNVSTEEGRAFGYQVTLFRSALAPGPPASASAWATNQAWMGHVAVTDLATGRHVAEERFARGALDLAGGRAAPFRVWLEDWALEGGAGGAFPLRVRAAWEGAALDLLLDPAKPPVAQGERGLSRKGPEPGNASYYYSFTRLATRGEVRVGGEAFAVRGWSWLDREWSTSALSPGTEGWDWFALQLDDGTELMLYRLRLASGGASPFSEGVRVGRDGGAQRLAAADATLEVTRRWRSPAGGALYPSAWRVRVPGAGLDLAVEAAAADQEWRGAIRYWEGAVTVTGSGPDGPVAGRGYAELTGYAGGSGGAGAGAVRGRAPGR